jgi:hypothetical protein
MHTICISRTSHLQPHSCRAVWSARRSLRRWVDALVTCPSSIMFFMPFLGFCKQRLLHLSNCFLSAAGHCAHGCYFS